MRWYGWASVLGCALLAGTRIAAQEGAVLGDPSSGALFILPDTREALTVALAARDLLSTGRSEDALNKLQELLEKHTAAVLPAGFDEQDNTRALYPTVTGAAEWARRTLLALPADLRSTYRLRNEPSAQAALRAARAQGSVRALEELCSRWPVTVACVQAWLSAGELQLEHGEFEAARRAWRAAEAALASLPEGEPLGADLPQAVDLSAATARRLDFLERESRAGAALARLAGQSWLGAGFSSNLPQDPSLPPALAGEAEAWPALSLDNNPFDGRLSLPESYNLFPVALDSSGARVLVSDSLRLSCVDAHSGVWLWQAPEAPGWAALSEVGRNGRLGRRDFFAGLDPEQALIAPAASRGVAVAALQVPVSSQRNEDYQGITITVVIPDRRLFAYDVETGKPLWDHRPPLLWDGESGDFTQRMHVAGPPVIVGNRVLAPYYRLQGRIDYHVGCFELSTGQLLWSTLVVSGQRELNMFGRHENEFCAPPLVIEGERVLCLTQLGALAALDLSSGRILWESVYEQLPLPTARGYHLRARDAVFENAPPCVLREQGTGVVLYAPADSGNLSACDLESGRVLWSLPERQLRAPKYADKGLDVLVGVDSERIYLGGEICLAWSKTGGLRQPGALQLAWSFPLQSGGLDLPRPWLGPRDLVVADERGLHLLDRQSGLARQVGPTEASYRRQGNSLLTDGALVTLSGQALRAYFDWDTLVRRAAEQLARAPEDQRLLYAFADLLERCASAALRTGDSARALEHLAEARKRLSSAPGSADNSELHQVLGRVSLTEARVRRELGTRTELAKALELAQQAAELCAEGPLLAEALFFQLACLDRAWFASQESESAPAGQQLLLAVLEQLETRVPTAPVPDADLVERASWLFAGALDPALLTQQSLASQLPARAFAQLVRAQVLAELGRPDQELVLLQEALLEWADQPLAARPGTDGPVLDLVEQLHERLRRSRARAAASAYAPYEAQAAALLEQARGERSGPLLERLRKLYPDSQAARAADGDLVGLFVEQNQLASLVELCSQNALRESTANTSDVEALAALAVCAGQAGNHELERELLRRCASLFPDLVPESLNSSLSLLALSQVLESAPQVEPVASRASFDASLRPGPSLPGYYRMLGRLLLPAGGTAAGPDERIYLRRDRSLQSFSARNPTAIRFEVTLALNGEARYSVLDQHGLYFSDGAAIVAHDPLDGAQRWRVATQGDSFVGLTEADGLLVYSEIDAQGASSVSALEAHSGAALWRTSLPRGMLWNPPIAGSGRVVCLARTTGATPGFGMVLDLFRGTLLGRLELGEPLSPDPQAAWIERGQLLVPGFLQARRAERNHVVAYELEHRTRAWSVEFREDRELHALARPSQPGATNAWLVVLPAAGLEHAQGALVELDTRLGATREIAPLRVGDEALGLPRRSYRSIESPWIFVQPRQEGALDTPITALELPLGKRWVHRLSVSYEELYDRGMPAPAISSSTVAVAFARRNPKNSLPTGSELALIDRESGVRRANFVLSSQLAQADELELVPLGPALFLIGRSRTGASYLEIWENSR